MLNLIISVKGGKKLTQSFLIVGHFATVWSGILQKDKNTSFTVAVKKITGKLLNISL